MQDYKTLYGNLVTGNWPNTTAKNASGPSATDGTPYTADLINDLWGARQDLLTAAGITPNGIAEASGTSQFMEALRRGAGLPPGMLVMGAFSPARMAVMRLLAMEGQLAPVGTYGKLVDAVWQGASTNNTVPAFYRCNSNKTKNAAGDYLYIPDTRGLFFRAAGRNSIYAAGSMTYNGMSVGDFMYDKVRSHSHSDPYNPFDYLIKVPNYDGTHHVELYNATGSKNVDAVRDVFYGDNETAPASLSLSASIAY